jgi:hypothetical protein
VFAVQPGQQSPHQHRDRRDADDRTNARLEQRHGGAQIGRQIERDQAERRPAQVTQGGIRTDGRIDVAGRDQTDQSGTQAVITVFMASLYTPIGIFLTSNSIPPEV